MDKYAEKYVAAIKGVRNDVELANLINKIYSEGFEDGVNSAENEEED